MNRLHIGLLLSHIEDDFASEICRGAMAAAGEIGAELTILPGRFLEAASAGRWDPRDRHFNSLFPYARDGGLDALVVNVGTICRYLSMDAIREFLASFGDIPIVTLCIRVPGYPCVRILDEPGFPELLEHLIGFHRKRRIAFVSGPKGHQEADIRLADYKRALAAHGIPYDKSLVGHGVFTLGDADVRDFVRRVAGRADAFCFASDEMASDGIQALRELGIEPGRDVAVTGYDDCLSVSTQLPELTTVAAHPSALGYEAVRQCAGLSQGVPPTGRELRSCFVRRSSCGCPSTRLPAPPAVPGMLRPAEEEAHRLAVQLFGAFYDLPLMAADVAAFTEFALGLFRDAADPRAEFSLSWMEAFLDRCLAHGFSGPVRQKTFVDVLTRLVEQARLRSSSPEKSLFLLKSTTGMLLKVNSFNQALTYSQLDTVRSYTYLIGSLLLPGDADENTAIRHLLLQLSRFDGKAGFLYLFDSPRSYGEGIPMPPADTLLLAGCYVGDRLFIPEKGYPVPRERLFDPVPCPGCPPMDDAGKQCATVVMPMYYGDVHYGLLLIRLEHPFLAYISNLAQQACIALRQTRLLTELRDSMRRIKSANNLLDMLSKVDELTGIYNRRGFFDAAASAINDPVYAGRQGMLLFADLMGLKSINDENGHMEGDRALRVAAEVLSGLFGKSGIVGRIGGDEFAAFSYISRPEEKDDLLQKTDRSLGEASAKLQSSYDVRLSLGVICFTCGEDLLLSELLQQADALQYADKARRRKRAQRP